MTAKDQVTLQNDLTSLSDWEGWWDAEFHTMKCNLLTVSRKREKEPSVLHGQELEEIQETVKKANQTLGFLRRNLKICSIQTKNLAYKALVRPILLPQYWTLTSKKT